ncbi:hypothetical protein HPP92_003740 [Vanilla planifolia]|uniref:Protein TIFY n=1 Tax=Vanilla planifolia TaxID=51239 RepID=A0A835S8J8_VANPL|nr:hypothetical protein HPP92_004173 [Vanilla planifolia]KAG0503668.1 hypothetical protein HPP92_003740 [Vanilla planifolia]
MVGGAETARRPEKSSFSMTCSLLSQYIKEKGSFADLGIGMPGKTTPTTMSLLPGVDVSGEDFTDSKEENVTKSMELFPKTVGFGTTSPPVETKKPEKAQLTIFYGGKIMVFDNFPAEKAQDLMQLAGKRQNFNCVTQISEVPPVATPKTCPSPVNTGAAQPNLSHLPIARKASLHRFLEKRKDRISAIAPYQLSGNTESMAASSAKEEISQQPWLGLGQNFS